MYCRVEGLSGDDGAAPPRAHGVHGKACGIAIIMTFDKFVHFDERR